MNKHKLMSLFEPLIAVVAGLWGSLMATLQPWQEQVEWGGRMLLLLLSIISVLIGIYVGHKRLTKKDPKI